MPSRKTNTKGVSWSSITYLPSPRSFPGPCGVSNGSISSRISRAVVVTSCESGALDIEDESPLDHPQRHQARHLAGEAGLVDHLDDAIDVLVGVGRLLGQLAR